MSQVSILAVDLPSGIDSIASQSNSTNDKSTDSSLFSDVMAKQQQQESGNDSQKSGNKETVSTSDKSLESINPQQVNEQGGHEKNENVDASGSANVDSNIRSPKGEVSADEKTEELDGDIISNSKNTDVAEKLLSFIVASDEVSTESTTAELMVDKKTYQNTVDKDVIVQSTATNDSEKELDTAEQDSSSSAKNSNMINTIKLTGDSTADGDSDGKPIELKNDNSAVLSQDEVKVAQTKVSQESIDTEATASNKLEQNKDAAQTVETLATKAVKDNSNNPIQLSAAKETEKTDKPSMLEQRILSTATKEQLNTGSSVDDNQNEKIQTDQTSVVNNSGLTADKTKVATQEVGAKVNVVDSGAIDVAANSDVNVTSDAKVSDIKMNHIAPSSTTASERTVNTATPSTASATSSSSQQQSTFGQSSNDNLTQQNDTPSDHSDHVSDEATLEKLVSAAGEKISEQAGKSFIEQRDAINTQADDDREHRLNAQSLVFSEEQAIHSTIAKASADSMSVQSAKTAINIHNETIAIYRKDFSNAVKDKVMVMVNQKIKQLEIRLDPPELGSMHVRLNLQNEQAAVNFVVQNQQAKEALEQNMDRLKDMLSDSGVDVGDTNIEQRDQQSEQQDEMGQQNSGRGFEDDAIDHSMAISGANLYKASATGVDYFA